MDYLRIPVTGPSPYNTLAVVHKFEWLDWAAPTDGKTYRSQVVAKSHLRIQGFDQRIKYPKPEHSTTVNLTHLWTNDDPSWLTAIDAVDGFFSDDDGSWCARISFAASSDADMNRTWDINSWVLFYEAPLGKDAGGVS